MLLLDITIVNVALPKIAPDLKASFSEIQWVIDAYALTLASVLLTAGTLADLLGRRLMFAIGLGLFSFASLLCALSPSAMFLIFARAVQGIGGAIMFATSLALLAQEFHGRERGTAFGAWGATIAASAAVGPLLGGFLTEDFGWSSIFYINVPIGIAALVLTLAKVAESREPPGAPDRLDRDRHVHRRAVPARVRDHPRQRRRMGEHDDRRPLRRRRRAADRVPDLAVRADERDVRRVAVPQADVQRRLDRGVHGLLGDVRDVPLPRPVPPDDPRLLAAPDRAAVPAVHGRVVLRRGRVGQPVGEDPGPGPARGWPAAHWRRPAADARPDRRSGWTALLAGFIVSGAGVGLINPALASTAIGVVPPQRSGMASGINNTFRQVGIATGIAVLGAIFESGLATSSRPGSPGRPPPVRRARSPTPSPRAAPAGARRGPRRPARPRRGRDPRRVRRDDERHPARRRDHRARRGGAGARARARQRLRHLRISRTRAGTGAAAAG